VAFKPLHSFAVQEDISTAGIVVCPVNPSEQNPLEQVCPMGQWLFARQGSLAEPPDILGAPLFDVVKVSTTKATTTASKTNPNIDLSFIASVEWKEIKERLVIDFFVRQVKRVSHKIHSGIEIHLNILEDLHRSVFQVSPLEILL
jgi:hypothetical protein